MVSGVKRIIMCKIKVESVNNFIVKKLYKKCSVNTFIIVQVGIRFLEN